MNKSIALMLKFFDPRFLLTQHRFYMAQIFLTRRKTPHNQSIKCELLSSVFIAFILKGKISF